MAPPSHRQFESSALASAHRPGLREQIAGWDAPQSRQRERQRRFEARNALETATLTSLQYAVHHLTVRVLVVLAHVLCGAVKAAQLLVETLESEMPA